MGTIRIEANEPELKELADAIQDEPADRLATRQIKRDAEGQQRWLEAYRRLSGSAASQKVWDSLEPELRAKTHIFSVLSEAFEEELGKDEGRAAVRRARQKQGEQMGKAMAERVRARGERLDLANYFNEFWSYFSWSPFVDEEKHFDEQGNLVKYVRRQTCHIGDYLRENYGDDTGFSSNFCDLDEYIPLAYNPNIRHYRKHWVPNGDLFSELVWELDSDGIID